MMRIQAVLGMVMLCLTATGCVSSIKVSPHFEADVDSASVEVGNTYAVKHGEKQVLYVDNRSTQIITSNKLYQPDVDSTFKSHYPAIKEQARFQIVGVTKEGNYVGWPLDGYRRKPKSKPGIISKALGGALTYVGGQVMDSLTRRIVPRSAGAVGSQLSPQMNSKINAAAVSTANGTGPGLGGGVLGKINSGVQVASQVATNANDAAPGAGGGSDMAVDDSLPQHSELAVAFKKAYRYQDTIFFFDKDTLKPYAVRPYVDRSILDQKKNHIFHKILDTEGEFTLTKSFLAVCKCTIEYQGVVGSTASFHYDKFVGDPDHPVVSEAIALDLQKSKTVEVDGFSFDVVYAGSDRAELLIKSNPN